MRPCIHSGGLWLNSGALPWATTKMSCFFLLFFFCLFCFSFSHKINPFFLLCISKPSQLSMFYCSSSWPLKVLQTQLFTLWIMLPSISWLSQWVSTDHPPHASLTLTAAGGLGAVSCPVLRAPGCWSQLQAHLCQPRSCSRGSSWARAGPVVLKKQLVMLCPVPGSTCRSKMRICVSHVMDCPLEHSTMKGMSKCAASKKICGFWAFEMWLVQLRSWTLHFTLSYSASL